MDKKPIDEGFRGNIAEDDVEGHALKSGRIAPDARAEEDVEGHTRAKVALPTEASGEDVEGHVGAIGRVREPVRRLPVDSVDDEDVEVHGRSGAPGEDEGHASRGRG